MLVIYVLKRNKNGVSSSSKFSLIKVYTLLAKGHSMEIKPFLSLDFSPFKHLHVTHVGGWSVKETAHYGVRASIQRNRVHEKLVNPLR